MKGMKLYNKTKPLRVDQCRWFGIQHVRLLTGEIIIYCVSPTNCWILYL